MTTDATSTTDVIETTDNAATDETQPQPMLKTININADADNGIELFLGPLEAAIMRAVWHNYTTTRGIFVYVRTHYEPTKTGELAFTSVTSTVDRLYRRGMLLRSGDRKQYVYTAFVPSEAAYIDVCLTRALIALIDAYPREAGKIIRDHAASIIKVK